MSSPTAKRLMGSVLYDEEEEIYKAWCFGLGDAGTSRQSREVISGGVYYFTSKDGIQWERPELDVVTLEGRPTNVVVLAYHSQHEKRWPGFYELFGVSNNQSDPDPSRRYKKRLWKARKPDTRITGHPDGRLSGCLVVQMSGFQTIQINHNFNVPPISRILQQPTQ